MSTAPPRTRVALLGFGVAGRVFHAPLIASRPELDLAVVVTPSAVEAVQVAALHPGTEVLTTPEELWRRAAQVDLVVIATPNASHVPLARAAVDAGLPVVLDKPLAVTAADGRDLLEAARARGVPLTTFLNRRLDGDFRTLQALCARGAFGRVLQFESRFSWWEPEVGPGWRGRTTVAEGGGVLYDLGPHLIDQAVRLFGPVVDARADLDRLRPDAVAEDHAFVRLVHAGGVRSRLWMSSATPLPGPRYWVLGSRAGYVQHGVDPQEAQLGGGMHPGDPHYGASSPSRWGDLGTDGSTVPVPTERGAYPTFYADVAAALRGDGPMPVDPADAVETLDLIERLHAGARRGTA
ncbi:Gfo/Idh/MocA family oxidoreductase [Cellulosimicrobium cellulans]|uniref:Gfo/Idh/MocA family protein n=1 Tax=Cellulosimicrobium cellulans TaxID=1710 RepID=UPI00130ECB97|nr:Gfo/Idh/MocA family oxidoreductase [Cellulosimicrobium cellulans]